jgi:hypothetical protein
MKMYWGGGVEVQLRALLISPADGCEWSLSLPGRFTPGERAPSTDWLGGWVGPQSQPERGGIEKESHYCPDRPEQPSHYTDWATPAPAYS